MQVGETAVIFEWLTNRYEKLIGKGNHLITNKQREKSGTCLLMQ